jgi:hypothetical protein
MKILGSILLLVSSMALAQSPVGVLVSPTQLTFTNNSTKPIVGIVVQTDAFGFYLNDFYSRSSDWIPGTSLTADTTHTGRKASTAATLVLWVQFNDGSTWGSSKAGAQILVPRTEAGPFLATLNTTNDDTTFTNTVQTSATGQHTDLTALANLLLNLINTQGISAARAEVANRLQNRANRKF